MKHLIIVLIILLVIITGCKDIREISEPENITVYFDSSCSKGSFYNKDIGECEQLYDPDEFFVCDSS